MASGCDVWRLDGEGGVEEMGTVKEVSEEVESGAGERNDAAMEHEDQEESDEDWVDDFNFNGK